MTEELAETHDAKPENANQSASSATTHPMMMKATIGPLLQSQCFHVLGGYENIERIDLLDRLHEGLKQHLVDVAKLLTGLRDRRSRRNPQGTTQYHWESYRHVREID